ncbi:hypothetical protein [Paenibacillus cremeus]|uniref:Homing endonuclease LAGLIDADG domain-containing protein n=1 Tax=Paenibacillus cremeus TaxID=2163881 RepID=A0A559KCK4_9BACL|nr:hypothetical protein [Paenibacillus cremeus]TVY09860.1 hypothetical protein FPZ49_10835 [Paenibacillus cremeus]
MASVIKFKFDKEELYDLFVNQLKTTKEIADIYGCTTVTVNVNLRKYGITWEDRDRNDPEKNKYTRECLYNLYIEEQKSPEEIAEIYNTTHTVIRRRLQKFNITYEMQKEKHHEQFLISELQHDVIIGSVLGDGALTRKGESSILTVFHQESQKEYCQAKFDVMRNLCPINELKFSYRLNESDGYNRQNQFYFYTRYIRNLNRYNDMNTYELLNNLNPNSLTVWYLDDGSLEIKNYRKGNGHIQFAMKWLNRDEIEYAIQMFKNKFNINAKIKWRKKEEGIYSGLKFDIADTEKLINVVKNSELGKMARETMAYKLLLLA